MTYQTRSGFFPLWMLCVVSMTLSACKSGTATENTLTYTTVRRPFNVTIDAEGVIEAQKAQTLSTPRFRRWRQLELITLAPEGSVVKKGDIVVQFDPQSFENDYQTALNTHEIARVESKN